MSSERATPEQVLELSKTLRNWGRWGVDDVAGTLNYITPEARQRGVTAIESGEWVSCAWNIDVASRSLTGSAHRFMISTGQGLGDEHRLGPAGHSAAATDALYLTVHGVEVTHLDALSHVFWDGQMYNGRPAEIVTSREGATEHGIENAGGGIVTRGVLLDIAAARGVPYLEPGDGVLPTDLEEAERRQGVRVESGDAVLAVTGFPAYRRDNSKWTGMPGWQVAALPWLHEREAALIGMDSGSEVFPTGYSPEFGGPLHGLAIAVMGLWILDNCNFDTLVEKCRARQKWTFLFVVAPLPFVGATGSPVNPIAIL
jgi:kynurenine formamidase